MNCQGYVIHNILYIIHSVEISKKLFIVNDYQIIIHEHFYFFSLE